MTIFSPRRFISASSGSGSLPGAAWRAGLAGACSCGLSFQGDVVDQAGRSRRGSRRRGRGGVEVGELDVVDVEAVAERARAPRPASRVASARGQGERALALVRREDALRDESARPSASRTVGSDASSSSRSRSRTIRRTRATCCASFWPKYATSRADDVEQLQADGGDAAEVAGAERALERSRRAPRRRPTSGSRAGTSPRPAGAKTTSTPAASAAAQRRAPRRAGSASRSSSAPNCAGLTNRLATTRSHSARAAREQREVPARGARPSSARARSARRRGRASAARVSAIVRDDLHGAVASASARYIGSSSGRRSRIAARCASTVAQSPRAIGPGQLEAVLDRPPHQRDERLGRRARLLEQSSRRRPRGA